MIGEIVLYTYICGNIANIKPILLKFVHLASLVLLLFAGDDHRVLLHEKSLFNRYKQTVIGSNEGRIGCVKWRGRFAAWTTPK